MWDRIKADVLWPLVGVTVGCTTWAGISAAMAAPLLALKDALPPWAVALWLAAAVFMGLMLAHAIVRGELVSWWKTRKGSRTLGSTVKGGGRNGRP